MQQRSQCDMQAASTLLDAALPFAQRGMGQGKGRGKGQEMKGDTALLSSAAVADSIPAPVGPIEFTEKLNYCMRHLLQQRQSRSR